VSAIDDDLRVRFEVGQVLVDYLDDPELAATQKGWAAPLGGSGNPVKDTSRHWRTLLTHRKAPAAAQATT